MVVFGVALKSSVRRFRKLMWRCETTPEEHCGTFDEVIENLCDEKGDGEIEKKQNEHWNST